VSSETGDAWPSPEQQRDKLELLLKDQFQLQPLPAFSIIVEGTTDEFYLLRAVQLYKERHGFDLLDVPKAAARTTGERIMICTPGTPGAPRRGGTPQMVRLADALRTYVFTLEIYSGLIFVFDHDDEGRRAQDQLDQSGYKKGRNSITLDPAEHPKACATKQVMVEDLLSLSIQAKYFDTGKAWCAAEYEEGILKRFKWGYQSKPGLCEFVCKNAALDDLEEVSRVVLRARQVFGLPTPG
jgi:hypothetical protein